MVPEEVYVLITALMPARCPLLQVYARSSTNVEGGDGKMTAAKQAMQAYKASADYVTPVKARFALRFAWPASVAAPPCLTCNHV